MRLRSVATLVALAVAPHATSCATAEPTTADPPRAERAQLAPSALQVPDSTPLQEPTAGASVTLASADAPTIAGPCPADMVDVKVACIDRFEAPNEKGAAPLLMQSVKDGETWCKQRGKRLCTEDEWDRACEGPSGKAFPYGAKYEASRCNDDGKFIAPSWKKLGRWPGAEADAEMKRLDQSEPSGARAGCVSDEGVFDLTGNVGEWVVRTKDNETNYSHVVKGCFWGRCFRPPHTPSCEYVNYAHPAGYRSYELGFRCCKDRSK
ncbi:MAG: SUMF1/EgtB/PvdO family nonheme iron enzyme [Polyangiaceae bacterium]|nr:SUMF1/EgtB/PvdO family nonheme iron enzyme [Polyangiaceae bacterium]